MAVSSIDNSGSYSISPYQADKEMLSNLTDSLSKSIDSKDFSAAEDTFESMQNLLQKKTNRRMSNELGQMRQEFENLAKALEGKDAKSAKEAITNIKDDLKNNKNLILKTHDISEIKSQLTSSFMTALYA